VLKKCIKSLVEEMRLDEIVEKITKEANLLVYDLNFRFGLIISEDGKQAIKD
jgi:hypothetical protein